MASPQVTRLRVKSTSRHRNHQPTRQKLIKKAEDYFEQITAYRKVADSVDDVKMIHTYCEKFLALPSDVLAEWENL